MVYTLLLASALIYSVYAYLPFLSLKALPHYLLGALLAAMGSVVWVTISRTVSKDLLVGYGLIFDAIITLAFVIVPLIAHGLGMGRLQIIACGLILLGVILFKV